MPHPAIESLERPGFWESLATGVQEQAGLLGDAWDWLNNPLQPAESSDPVEGMMADETTPFNLAVNLLPPLAAVKRFRHLPAQLAQKFGDIQDQYKMTGGNVPTYHGTNKPFAGAPEFKTMEEAVKVPGRIAADNPAYDAIRNKISDLQHRRVNQDRYDIFETPPSGWGGEWGMRERADKIDRVVEQLRSNIRSEKVPQLYSYLDPQPATEFGGTVMELKQDLSNHGYSPWDIKGQLSPVDWTKDVPRYKQDIYDKMKGQGRSGMVLDPVQYIDEIGPAYAGAPTEDFVPQISTWDLSKSPELLNVFRRLDDNEYHRMPMGNVSEILPSDYRTYGDPVRRPR